MYRQGDVLLVPTAQVPKDAKPVKRTGDRTILALGEATGHHHSFAGGAGVELLEAPDGKRFLRVHEADTGPWACAADAAGYADARRSASAALEHQEHTTIPVAPGLYEVVIQREYDDAEEWRRVQD